jgi:glycosyltransferase involved in cell wall biosynthesis
LAESLPGERSILTCHDIIPLLASRGILDVPITPWGRRTFLRRLDAMRRCARIVAVSECTRRDLIQHAGMAPDRITVVPNGLDTSFQPNPPGGQSRADEARRLRREWGLPDDARVVLHVGTRNRYKNTTAVIRAMAQVRSHRADTWLVRIGAPLFDDDALLVDTSGLADRYVHAGRVSDATLRAAYRAADVFVFPSLYEGFGWPPAEAMASGTPVVVSNAGSLPEVVGDAAPTVAPGDVDALAREVCVLLDDPDLRERRIRAGLEQAARFRWENTVDAYRTVYAEVGMLRKNSPPQV